MADLFERAQQQATPQSVISVAELNRLARSAVERSVPLTWVAGEISNFKRYDSGHCYFTLKDSEAQVDAVMFRHKAQYLDWQPSNGLQVEVRATATVYEARGKFQLVVDAMRRAGLGALYAAFEKLKGKLEAEGLFDAALKRELPALPRTVGVVTSPQAAALRDVITALGRRMPGIAVIVYPTPVQGDGAGEKIAEAIRIAGERAECEVLIVCRGGGSIEDLWAFNDEAVARAIRACPLPVVSGVGHETDFTIADFAADLRAPTPTAAAELVSPDGAKLRRDTVLLGQQLQRVFQRELEDRMQRIDFLGRRLVHPGEQIRNRMVNLQHLATRLSGAWTRGAEDRGWQLRGQAQRLRSALPGVAALRERQQEFARRLRIAARMQLASAGERLQAVQASLTHLNPERVLERGYSITRSADGTIIREAAQLKPEQELELLLAKGRAEVRVKKVG
jgi:exodeoxyribonuclease VII large subunit